PGERSPGGSFALARRGRRRGRRGGARTRTGHHRPRTGCAGGARRSRLRGALPGGGARARPGLRGGPGAGAGHRRRPQPAASRESELQAALSRLLDAAAGAGAEEAREHARDIIALGQDALEAHGDLAFAERCLEEALGLDPDCEEALALAQAIDAARNRPAPGAWADACVGTPEPQADAAVGEASRTDAAARARESV